MRKLQNKWHFVLLALGIMLLICLIQLIQRKSSEAVLATPVQVHASTEAFFAANVQDIAGKTQTLSQWRGKLLVINFWATWCAPCREEMPELDALQKAHADQLTVLGISLDDLAKTQAYAQQSPVSYPLLAADVEGMALSASLGNIKSVVPYTVIIDSDGKILRSYFGRVSEALLMDSLQGLLSPKP